MKIIIDSKKYGKRTVLIDDEDYDKVKMYKWHIVYKDKKNNVVTKPVVRHETSKSGKRVRIDLCKLILPCDIIEHVDHDALNNKRENLRAHKKPAKNKYEKETYSKKTLTKTKNNDN